MMARKNIKVILILLILILCSSCGVNGDSSNDSTEGWTKVDFYNLSYLENDLWKEDDISDINKRYLAETYSVTITNGTEMGYFKSIDDFIKQSQELTTEEEWAYTVENQDVSDWSNDDFSGKIITKHVKYNDDYIDSMSDTHHFDDKNGVAYFIAFSDNSNNLYLVTAMSTSKDELFKKDIEIFLNSIEL